MGVPLPEAAPLGDAMCRSFIGVVSFGDCAIGELLRRADWFRCGRMPGQERERIICFSFTTIRSGTSSSFGTLSAEPCVRALSSDLSERSVEQTLRALGFLEPQDEADSGRSRMKGEAKRGTGCGRTSQNAPRTLR